ncbi:hypothetical protein [Xylanibacter brevis]|uniref:hypothetical protein n=1 Tax=Xylanibacter brevis TaxID=83231 RepID=UPI00048913D2|nr:hypothetical protein [Xylanibacter brevis]
MKDSYLHIVPECYVDTNLVQILMQIKGVNHQNSCGQVTNVIKNKFKDKFAIGIVDNDNLQSNYSNACVEIARSNELILCKHPENQHYLIKINHVMEKFILNSAKDANVDLKEFGIPDDLEGLKNVTKSKTCLENSDLRKAIKAVSISNEMQLLTEVLNYLQANKYNSKSDELIGIFKVHGFMKQ